MTNQITITTGEALMLHHELSGFYNESSSIKGLLNHKLPFNVKLQLHKLSSQVELIKTTYDAEMKPVFERLGTIIDDRYFISSDSPNMAEYQLLNFELLNTEVILDVPSLNLECFSDVEDEHYYQIFAKIYSNL